MHNYREASFPLVSTVSYDDGNLRLVVQRASDGLPLLISITVGELVLPTAVGVKVVAAPAAWPQSTRPTPVVCGSGTHSLISKVGIRYYLRRLSSRL